MRRGLVAGFALAALAVATPASAAPLPVRLDDTRGWPRNAAERAVFDSAFMAVLLAPVAGDRTVEPDTTLHPDSLWHVRVVVGLPPELPQKRTVMVRAPGRSKPQPQEKQAQKGQRATRGLTVVIEVASPLGWALHEEPRVHRFAVAFPGEEHDPYPFGDAGAAAGGFALEALWGEVAPAAGVRAEVGPGIRVPATRGTP